MDTSKMKNMIVLRNLPSNIIDEAFVVLKSNKKVKNVEKIEKNKKVKNQENNKKDNEYVIKEAEILVSDYISKIENKTKFNCNNKKKSKGIKIWAYISTLIAFVEWLLLLSA